MRLRWVGLLAVMAMVLASCGGGVPEAAGPSEGIQVHGEWTIDVYNEDGSLDRHVEFSNALATVGRNALIRLLAGTRSPSGAWTIRLSDSGNDLCPSETSGQCLFSGNPVSVLTDGQGFAETLRLSGTTIVEASGDVVSVETRTGQCAVTVAPSDCDAATDPLGPFTIKVLADPIPVAAGQSVQVQVDISFTSG